MARAGLISWPLARGARFSGAAGRAGWSKCVTPRGAPSKTHRGAGNHARSRLFRRLSRLESRPRGDPGPRLAAPLLFGFHHRCGS